MKKLLLTALFILSVSSASFAYDQELAAKFDKMFFQFTQEVLAIAPCQITPEKVLEMLN